MTLTDLNVEHWGYDCQYSLGLFEGYISLFNVMIQFDIIFYLSCFQLE